jgi:O-antigen ligase
MYDVFAFERAMVLRGEIVHRTPVPIHTRLVETCTIPAVMTGQGRTLRAYHSELIQLSAWVVLLLSGLFLLTTGGTYPGIASPEAHIVGQVIAYVVLGGWLLLALRRPEWRPQTPLLLPVLAASGAYLLSFVFSQRPRLSLEPTVAGLGWALAFLFLTCLLARPWFRARVGVLLTAFVAIVAFGYLAQVAIEWVSWWRLIGRFALPPLRPSFAALFLGSPNLIATALILGAPLVVAIAWSKARRRRLAVVLAIAAALATFVSGSRGAFLGVGVGTMVALLLFAGRRGGFGSTVGALVGPVRRRPILVFPVAVVVGLAAVFAPAVLSRFAQGGESLRFDLWRSAASIFVDHPIFGSGPGTWVQLKVAANPPGVPNLILPHAHDMYVQAAAEVGLVGLVALAWLVFAVARRLWSGSRSSDQSISIESGAVLVSLAAFAGQSVVDNFSNLPFVLLLVVLLVAWVDCRLAQLEPESVSSPGVRARRWLASPVPAALALAALVVLTPTLVRIDLAAFHSGAGDDAANRGYWTLALAQYDAARLADPGFTLYELQTGSSLARLGRNEEARDILASAVASDGVAVNLVGLAALDHDLGDNVAATRDLDMAVARGIGEPMVALNAGLIAERLGDATMAVDQFANAMAWDPPLGGAKIWNSTTHVSKADVVAAARQRAGPFDAALIRAYAGDVAGARVELEAMPASSTRQAYLATVLGLGGDFATAMGMFEAGLATNPSDWVTAAMATRTAQRAGNEVAVNRYRRWSIAVQGDAAPGVIAEGSVVPASVDDPWAGLPGNYTWAIYLRPDAPYLVMPQLIRVRAR